MDLGLSARGGNDGGHLAAALDLRHRFGRRAVGFASARAGIAWNDETTETFATALTGLRWRW